MQVTSEDRAPRSFTASARRAQIVEAAIETIAEVGFASASFSRIAKRAGLSSTRLISYHFDGKDELVAAITADVLSCLGEFVGRRMRQETTPDGALRTYLLANIEFTSTHRSQMKALLAIFMSGGFSYDAADNAQSLSPIEAILADGQASGVFRGFDTSVMAAVIQHSVEGLPFLLESRPDLDPGSYADEVTTLFDLATRRTP